MATDWAADVRKYAANADDGVIAGIVRYCGIALHNRDSALVSFSDPKELDRVRNNFLKKKLGLTQADKTLDAAIAKVGEVMKADLTKNRVTVYYLLADNFRKLDLFAAKPKAVAKPPAKKAAGKAAGVAAVAAVAGAAAAKAPAKKDAPAKKAAPAKKSAVATTRKAAPKKTAIKTAAPQGLIDKAATTSGAKVAGTAAAAGAAAVVGAASAAKASDGAGTAGKVNSAVSQPARTGDDEDSGMGWLWWLLLALLAAFLIWWLFLRGPGDEGTAPAAPATEAAAADLALAPAEGSVEIPAGAGVTSELRDGKPVVKVYFDTGKTDVAAAFAGAAGGLKAWLEANAGSSLAISGYNDPSGNAAANAELAKNRAQAVQAALVAAGIAESSAQLVKPESTADATVPPEAARRVEVVVR